MTESRISDLERYGDKGWQWTETHGDEYQEVTQECRTDGNGEGIWTRSHDDGTWQQGLGTLQFQVPADEGHAMRYLIARRVKGMGDSHTQSN